MVDRLCVQELEKTASGLRDALAESRGHLQDLQHQVPSNPASKSPLISRSHATLSRAHEQLELANSECVALREEAAELESEARDLRRSLDEAESSKNAHLVAHRQLTKSLADAQAGIKQLLAEGDVAAAEMQRARGRIAELEDSQQRLLQRLSEVERERTQFGNMTLQSNVSGEGIPLSPRDANPLRKCHANEPHVLQREASVLEERAQAAFQRASELSSELMATGASLSDAQHEVRALQRELSATKHDASQMVKVSLVYAYQYPHVFYCTVVIPLCR